jgi:hypothetical protein
MPPGLSAALGPEGSPHQLLVASNSSPGASADASTPNFSLRAMLLLFALEPAALCTRIPVSLLRMSFLLIVVLVALSWMPTPVPFLPTILLSVTERSVPRCTASM